MEEETKAAQEVSETKEEQPTETEEGETPTDSTEKMQDEVTEVSQEEASKVTEEETSKQGEDQNTETQIDGNNTNDDVIKSNDNVKSDNVANDVAENANENVGDNVDVNDDAQNIRENSVKDNVQSVSDNADVNDNAQIVSNENIEADDNTLKEGTAEGEVLEGDQREETTLTDTGGDDQIQPEGETEAAKEQTVPTEEAEEKIEGEGVPTEESGEIKEDQNAVKVEGEETPKGEEKPSSEKGESLGEGDTPAGDGEMAPEESQPPSGEEQPPSGEQDVAEDSTKSPIPQSDTFTEGDRAESPVPQTVGEKLSRGPTPALDEVSREDTQTEILEPGTPERPGTPVEGETQQDVRNEADEEKTPEPQFDREALIEKYNAALAEREQLKQQNYQLQHKLAEYFRKKKSDDRTDYDKNVTDQEQRYLKYMDQLQELQKLAKREKETYKLQINDLEDKCKERKKKVDEERNKFTEFKQVVALNSLNSRSGKPIPPKDIEQYLINEEKKENEVVNVRLENIKSKNKLKKKEQQLKSKEELAEGLHLIDFEQLKIENQTYNEKIEERNEELLKLRKKITSTVQVLTHLKEKLQFVQAENQIQKKNLHDVEALVGQKRDILSRTKQARDSLRIDNHKLRQNCGLLGNEPLLRDFEERKDEGDDLKIKLEELRSIHAELALNCNQVRRKIEQARMGQV